MTKSFEDRFFDELSRRFDAQDSRMDEQDKKLAKILTQAQKTNGRVNKHDVEIAELKKVKTRRLNIPTNVLYLIAFAAVLILLIAARLMNIPLGGIT